MSPNARRVLFGALGTVVVVAGLILFAVGPASDREVSNLGPEVFEIDAETVRLASEEGPLYFPDPLDELRDLYVFHRGDSVSEGYKAYSARGPASGCKLQFDRERLDLVDTCDQSRYPAHGAGLNEYPVRYDNGKLFIDVNFAERAERTETEPDKERP